MELCKNLELYTAKHNFGPVLNTALNRPEYFNNYNVFVYN